MNMRIILVVTVRNAAWIIQTVREIYWLPEWRKALNDQAERRSMLKSSPRDSGTVKNQSGFAFSLSPAVSFILSHRRLHIFLVVENLISGSSHFVALIFSALWEIYLNHFWKILEV